MREGEEGVELGVGTEQGALELHLRGVVPLLLHLVAVVPVPPLRLLLRSLPVFVAVSRLILKSTISAHLVLLPEATFPFPLLAHPEVVHHFERQTLAPQLLQGPPVAGREDVLAAVRLVHEHLMLREGIVSQELPHICERDPPVDAVQQNRFGQFVPAVGRESPHAVVVDQQLAAEFGEGVVEG